MIFASISSQAVVGQAMGCGAGKQTFAVVVPAGPSGAAPSASPAKLDGAHGCFFDQGAAVGSRVVSVGQSRCRRSALGFLDTDFYN